MPLRAATLTIPNIAAHSRQGHTEAVEIVQWHREGLPGQWGPKRLYGRPVCASVASYLEATWRALRALGTLPADRTAAVLRRVLATANILPTRWERLRDARGRFTKDGGAPPGEPVMTDKPFGGTGTGSRALSHSRPSAERAGRHPLHPEEAS